jgi:diguanylate cyclase (GGDEF)-like protein/PAS domain S-box-containing protein
MSKPSPLSVLIVDDAPENLKILSRILQQANYEVRSLPKGSLVMRSVRLEKPDLIMLDIMMPDMNGYEVCSQLKANTETRDIPIIFISALQDIESKVRAFQCGGIDYVTKPFQIEEVLVRVSTHLKINSIQKTLYELNNRLNVLLNSAGEGIIALGRQGRIQLMNPKALELLGYPSLASVPNDLHTLIHAPEDQDNAHPAENCSLINQIQQSNQEEKGRSSFFRQDGTWFPVEYTLSHIPVHSQNPEEIASILLFHDITERLNNEIKLKESATVFEVSTEGIFITDKNGLVKHINPAFTQLTGYEPEDLIGQSPRTLKSGYHLPKFYHQLWQQIKEQGYWEGEVWNRHKSGRMYPHWATINAIKSDHDETIGYVAFYSDIARRKLTEQEIRHRGNFDALTGLANRSLMLDHLEAAIEDHQRKDQKLALITIDINRFKSVNESLGYDTGDILLQIVAARIGQTVRVMDTTARFGADEFVILLKQQNDEQSCQRIIDKLIKNLTPAYNLNEQSVEISISMGIALFPNHGRTSDQLLRNSHFALTNAKKNPDEAVSFFNDTMYQEIAERYWLEIEIQKAVKEACHFELYYQLIMDLQTGKPSGVESLIRWQHPEAGMIRPDKFIPIAEANQLIIPLGVWIIETACYQLLAFQKQGLDLYVSINVSACQIPAGVSPQWLKNLIERLGINPQKLALEITESLFIQDFKLISAWLSAVRDLGVRVFLDDFGTGYSSLSYLKNFPVDVVKIDQGFVRDMVTESWDLALVTAILAMCNSLGLKVVAEGIETEAQHALLSNLQCDYGQGYLFSKPLKPQELELKLQELM